MTTAAPAPVWPQHTEPFPEVRLGDYFRFTQHFDRRQRKQLRDRLLAVLRAYWTAEAVALETDRQRAEQCEALADLANILQRMDDLT